MNQHKRNNLCYAGYVRPADVDVPKKNLPKPIAQSQQFMAGGSVYPGQAKPLN
jgi:hypothetical protein